MSSKAWKEANPEKMRKYRRDWYERNKKKAIAKTLDRKRMMQQWFAKLKSELECKRCEEDHPACIVFHHRDPSKKEIDLGNVVRCGWSKKRILEEIKKCTVLCQNCHLKLHYRKRKREPVV